MKRTVFLLSFALFDTCTSVNSNENTLHDSCIKIIPFQSMEMTSFVTYCWVISMPLCTIFHSHQIRFIVNHIVLLVRFVGALRSIHHYASCKHSNMRTSFFLLHSSFVVFHLLSQTSDKFENNFQLFAVSNNRAMKAWISIEILPIFFIGHILCL